MSLAIAYSRAQVGIQALEVRVKVHLTDGLPGMSIVGLPEATVVEALQGYELMGELWLSGELRANGGVLPAALAAWGSSRQLIFLIWALIKPL